MWRGCIPPPHPPLAVTAPRAWLTLFGSLVGSGLQWAQLPHPLPTRSPSPTLKPSSFSPRQGQSSLLAWAQPNVCTQLLRGGRGNQLSPITTHPHALTSCPPQHPCSHHSPRCTRGTPSACLSPFPSHGECGLAPAAPLLVPRHPLLTLLLSPQAPGAGCWRTAAGAPRQAPPPLHSQLHQHQVRGAGPWDAAVTAPAMRSHPGWGAGRDWAVVGMGRGSVLPGLTLCPPPRQRRGPRAHLPHPAEPPEPLAGGCVQPGW